MRYFLFLFAIAIAAFSLCVPSQTFAQSSSFSFGAAGDFGGGSDAKAVLNAIPGNVDMFFVLGDMAYSSSNWCSFVKGSIPDTFPFELIAGNHDDDVSSAYNVDTFAGCLSNKLGGLQGTYGKEYYVDHPSSSPLARFIMIGPNLTFGGSKYSYSKGSSHYQWLSSAIDGARTANIPWVVVGMHENCISMGNKSCSISIDLMNLLVEKKVDIILQAHDHNYQRSKQLAFGSSCTALSTGSYNAGCVADDGADNAYTKGAGSILVIDGTAGQGLYNINTRDSEAGYFANGKWMGGNINTTKGFIKFTVSASQMQAQFVRAAGGTFTDAFTISGSASLPPPTAGSSPAGSTPTVRPTSSLGSGLTGQSATGGNTSSSSSISSSSCAPPAIGTASCLVLWKEIFTGQSTASGADFNGDGVVSLSDFETWRQAFFASLSNPPPSPTPTPILPAQAGSSLSDSPTP